MCVCYSAYFTSSAFHTSSDCRVCQPWRHPLNMIDGKTPPSLSPTVPTMGFHWYLTGGPDGSDVGVASGGSNSGGGSAGGGATAVGVAKMSAVARNTATSMPSSGDTPSRKPVRLCQVCGDIAKSLHFGGLSCDSCKAFFRRSVQNDAYKHFRCGGDQKCAISIASRKFCKYCRFAKCESIGMTKSWVMSEDERLQLMKTRLTKRMMYQQGGSTGGSGGGGSVGGAGGGGRACSTASSGVMKDASSPYHTNASSKTQVSRYQHNTNPSPTYHPPTRQVDLGSSGSSPNSSPPTPVSGPLTPIQYGPIPPKVMQQCGTKEESPDRSLGRGIKRESDDEEMRVERVFNPASQYLNESEVDMLTRVISNIKLVDQQLPYTKNTPADVMSIYKRFAERLTRFLRQFPEFNNLTPMVQGMAIKKNITVIALVFASSFINEETGSYNNIHSPAQPMVTNMNMIQKAMSPEVFSKFREILGSLRQYNVDSRMAYLLVLIIVFNCDGQDSTRENFQRILQQYILWKYGEVSGKPLFEGLMRTLQAVRRHSELFENMSVQRRNLMCANMQNNIRPQITAGHINQCRQDLSLSDLDVKHKVDSLTGEQIRQMLNGMDIEQMKQMLQGNGLEQMKQMLQNMEADPSLTEMVAEGNNPLVHSPPLHCNSPQSMVQSPHSLLQSPHSMLPSPHSMMQSPQSMMQSPHSMMDSPHSMIQSSSPGMMQPSNMNQGVPTMLDISHNLSQSPNATVSQIIKSSTNLLNNYQDMKPPVSFMNSPQSLELSQSPIELPSPSSHSMNLAPSPAPYIPNQESYIVEHHPTEPSYPDHCQSPIGDTGYLNPPSYTQTPYSPAPLSDQYSNTYQPLFSPLPYKDDGQSISSGSTASSSGVGLSLTSSLTSPISSLLTSPTPSHSSLQESDNSLSNYQEPEHGNSLGAAP